MTAIYVSKSLFYSFSQLSFVQFTTLHLSTEDDIHLLVENFERLRHIEHRETPEGRTAAGVKFAGCTLHLQRLRIDRRTAFLGSDYTILRESQEILRKYIDFVDCKIQCDTDPLFSQ